MLPVDQFVNFIEQNALFTPDAKILAAVSGGIDSVLMARLFKAAGYNFSIAHCNFQLRGNESLRDLEFCRNLADELSVPFHSTSFDTKHYAADKKISIQMAARDLRYQWFDTISRLSGYQAVALAHHQNDAIETILLNLTRGTGIAGLHGIMPKNGLLVRPLLFLTRDEIAAITTSEDMPYVEDSSNASVKYARNKIRMEVIPKLKQLNPSLEKTFEHNLRHFRDMELLLQIRLNELRKNLFKQGPDEIFLPLNDVKALNPQKLLLFNLLQEYGFNETAVNDLISSLDKHSGRVFESADHLLLLDRDRVILKKKNGIGPQPVTITNHDHEVSYGSYKLSLLHNEAAIVIKNNPMLITIDSTLLIYPLTLRPWQQGDHFYPLGMTGGKKLSDYFIGQKVPLHQKKEIPLLINGNGDIMWVAGYRSDERYKVNDATKKVTIFKLHKLR